MQGWQVVLILLAIGVLLSSPLWKGTLLAAISSKGDELGNRALHRNDAVHDTVYRTALDLDGDEQTVRAAIAAAEKKGKAKPAEANVWHIAAVYKNAPLVAQLSEIPNGYRLEVTQPIIHDGTPIMSQAWSNFRDGVATAAASQGLTTRLTEVAV